MTKEELEKKYEEQIRMTEVICTLLKRIDELEKRCEKLEERESIHNAIDGALNVQKQLDEHAKKIHNIGSYLEPIHNKLDKINVRLDDHEEKINKIDKALMEHEKKIDNLGTFTVPLDQKLTNVESNVDKLKTRLNMIFGAGGGVHLATYGMMIESDEENTKKAAKVIKNYCHGSRSCYECPFFNKKPSTGYEGCEFTRIAPCAWNMEEKKNG